MLLRGSLVLLLAAFVLPLCAESDDPHPGVFMASSPLDLRVAPTPPLRASSVEPRLVLNLPGIDPEEMMLMRAENDASPMLTVGRVRETQDAFTVRDDRTSASLPWRWRGSVRVKGADRVRLRLEGLQIDPSARLWLYSDTEIQSFTPELAYDGVLWTPSVGGEIVTLEIESPVAGTSFTLAAAADIRKPIDVVPNSTACLTDAQCFPGSFPDRRSAYAIFFVITTSGKVGQCSGALLADDNGVPDDRPLYFLTANHCIDTAGEAANIEIFWDYNSAYCNAPRPALETLPRSSGATLLVASPATDVALMRLNSAPGGRWFLGWDPRSSVLTSGMSLYRVSYPNGAPSSYSQSIVTTTSAACTSAPRPDFLYSSNFTGSTDTGSSGSPTFYFDPQTNGAYVIGQLLGSCGPNLGDACDARNLKADGSFAASWPLLQPYLRPAPTNTACVQNSTTSCLLGSRFEVTIDYRNQFASPPQSGKFVTQRLDPSATNPDTAIFGFGNAKAVEATVRLVDARPYAPRFDVYHGGLTDVEYWVNVRDTKTGVIRRYHKAPGVVGGGVDRASFPTP